VVGRVREDWTVCAKEEKEIVKEKEKRKWVVGL
jgi:hypothetical protein